MAPSSPNPFDRAFPKKDLCRGSALRAALWSLPASLCLVAGLLAVALTVQLLADGGQLSLTVPLADQPQWANDFLQSCIKSNAVPAIRWVPATDTSPSEDVADDGRPPDDADGPAEQSPPNDTAPETTDDASTAEPDGLAEDTQPGRPMRVRFSDSGLLPVIWNWRGTIWGRCLSAFYLDHGWMQQKFSALIGLLCVGVLLALLHVVCVSQANRAADDAVLTVSNRFRNSIHRQNLRLGPSDLTDVQGEQALTLFTTELDRLATGLRLYVDRLNRRTLQIALLLVLALTMDFRLTFMCLIPLAFVWYLVERLAGKRVSARRLDESRAETEFRLLSESLQKTRLVRGFGMDAFEQKQFEKYLHRFAQILSSLARHDRRFGLAVRTVVVLGVFVVVALAGVKVLQTGITSAGLPLGGGLLLILTFACLYRPVKSLWDLRDDLRPAVGAADHVYRFLDQIPEVSQAVGAKFLQPISESIQFESVSYRLPKGRKVLDGFDVKLKARQTVALISLDPLAPLAVGYLMARFIEPQRGRILFDGEDIAWVTLESLRVETAFVGGNDPFFTGTVRENINCGNSRFSLQETTEAAKLAHAHNFILKLPQGYETVLGEHGERLDSGQSFRLGVARAVLRNPALVVVEEPADALDDDTKSLVEDAYNRLVNGRTVVFIPSRLSTVRRADCVVFIHQGAAHAIGRHAELVQSTPLYRHWEYLRFNEFRHVIGPQDESRDGAVKRRP